MWPLVWKFKKQIGIALAVLSLLAYVQWLRISVDRAIVAKNNAEAAADTLRVLGIWNETVFYNRLAMQDGTIKGLRDSLKIKGKTKVETKIVVQPAPVEVVHDVPVPAYSDSVGRVLTDSVIGPPADARVAVTIAPDWSSKWEWGIRPSPISLTVDIGCRDRLKPDVVIGAPEWVRLDSVQTKTTTDVCGNVASTKSTVKTVAVITAVIATVTAVIALVAH